MSYRSYTNNIQVDYEKQRSPHWYQFLRVITLKNNPKIRSEKRKQSIFESEVEERWEEVCS